MATFDYFWLLLTTFDYFWITVCLFVCLFSTSYINKPDGQTSLFTVEGSTILQYYSIRRDVELVVMPVSWGVQAQGGVRPRDGGVKVQGASGPGGRQAPGGGLPKPRGASGPGRGVSRPRGALGPHPTWWRWRIHNFVEELHITVRTTNVIDVTTRQVLMVPVGIYHFATAVTMFFFLM